MDGQIDQSYSPNTLVQCRICHDEDEDSNMETPCSCCGTLKYAHRTCVQRWCNEKGDTTCEICQQQLKGYINATPPAPLFNYDGSPINFGGNWEISRRDLHNHQFIAFFANREFLDLDFDYPAPSTRSLISLRIIAIIFIVALVLRHTLPIYVARVRDMVLGTGTGTFPEIRYFYIFYTWYMVQVRVRIRTRYEYGFNFWSTHASLLPIIFILNGEEEYSLTVFMLLVSGIFGIIVPLYIMVKAITAIQRLQYQDHYSPMQSHEENDMGQSQLRVINVQ